MQDLVGSRISGKVEVNVSDKGEIALHSDPDHYPRTGATFDKSKFGFTIFNEAKFLNGVEFNEVEFWEARFNKCVFGITDDAMSSFWHSTFTGGVEFEESNFNGNIEFIKTTFKENASFSKSIFGGSKVQFNNASFSNVTFRKAEFKSERTIFNNTKFNGSTEFFECSFKTQIEFHGTIFNKQVSFGKSKFEDVTMFSFSGFKETAVFKYTVFGNDAIFNNVTFEGEAWFKGVEFKRAVEFKSTKFQGKAIFDDSVFGRAAIFVEEEDTTNEPAPKFYDRLSFANCDFRQGVDFLGSLKRENNIKVLWDFLTSRFLDLNSLIEATRVQRLSFEHEGKRDEADKMFVIEMRAKRKVRLLDSRNKRPLEQLKAKTQNFVEWLLADISSEYGTSWQRILYVSILVVLSFGLIYWLSMIKPRKVGFLEFNFGIIATFIMLSYMIYLWASEEFEDIPTLKRLILGIIDKRAISKVAIGTLAFYSLYLLHNILPLPNNWHALDNATISLSSETIVAPNGTFGSYIGTLLNALYYSLVTFTTLGYGDMHPMGWLKALSGLEALTGAVFMALIVAVIARKWMR